MFYQWLYWQAEGLILERNPALGKEALHGLTAQEYSQQDLRLRNRQPVAQGV